MGLFYIRVNVKALVRSCYRQGHGIKDIWYLVHGSKQSVFPEHCPERAREDQNLTTGPHFSAGHAQWRYALAT
jgi:hypothetical protein